MQVRLSKLLTWAVAVLQAALSLANDGKCRSKFGKYEPEVFRIHACAWCYHYISRSNDITIHYAQHYLYVLNNKTVFPQYTILIADAENKTMADNVCRTTDAEKCVRWKRCCREAADCCQNHIKSSPKENGSCPRTWDGYGCWEDTRPGTTVYINCPGFLEYSIPSRYAEKRCREDGSWFALGNTTKDEWTDYKKCLDKKTMLVSIYLGLACNIASVALLVPAIGIFVLYRPLRKQHRIRLHINFFVALAFYNILTILWEVLVAHNRLVTTASDSSVPFLFQSGHGCKVLAFIRLYSLSATYVWMFCEGFYLHRLISNAFRPPKSLLFLYLIGWGFPLCYTSVYCALRIFFDNERCWVRSHGSLQYILYAPNLGSLAVNFIFLCNILRILVTQLQSHPNEPSNFRRAIKATFVLIPLFGVQLFVTIYRHPAGKPGAFEYEKFSVLVLNSQGFFVALIFCFFNGEVLSYVKRTCTRMGLTRKPTESSRGQTAATSINFIHQGPDSHESENGTLMFESPRPSPSSGKKTYNTMQTGERTYQYIPLTARQISSSPTNNST